MPFLTDRLGAFKAVALQHSGDVSPKMVRNEHNASGSIKYNFWHRQISGKIAAEVGDSCNLGN